jgi:hypothetical protein
VEGSVVDEGEVLGRSVDEVEEVSFVGGQFEEVFLHSSLELELPECVSVW